MHQVEALRKTAIVVSPDPSLRSSIACHLRDCGWRVETCAAGAAAYTLMTSKPEVGLVVTTPEVSDVPLGGLWLCSIAWHRERDGSLPVKSILVGTYNAEDAVRTFRELVAEASLWTLPSSVLDSAEEQRVFQQLLQTIISTSIPLNPSFNDVHTALQLVLRASSRSV